MIYFSREMWWIEIIVLYRVVEQCFCCRRLDGIGDCRWTNIRTTGGEKCDYFTYNNYVTYGFIILITMSGSIDFSRFARNAHSR